MTTTNNNSKSIQIIQQVKWEMQENIDKLTDSQLDVLECLKRGKPLTASQRKDMAEFLNKMIKHFKTQENKKFFTNLLKELQK